MRLALYQPDIPQNTGTILRLAACLGVPVDVIGPTGFDMTDRALKRSGMDYLDCVEIVRHIDFDAFNAVRIAARRQLVLVTTKSPVSYLARPFKTSDVLLMGRESAGVPDTVHAAADARVTIPLRPGLRSLNIAVAAALVLGEALRQTQGFPST
jgi:tRNA (cytidine/uridine-2'-O-)-methyltransferase